MMKSTKDVSKYDYLRRRQFLVIETYIVPVGGVRTERKGWKEHNFTLSERHRVVDRISDKIMKVAAVIIDVQKDRVVKNRFKSDATLFDDEALAHFKGKYPEVWFQA